MKMKSNSISRFTGKHLVFSNVQKSIAFIIILSILFCSTGCYKRVAVGQPQERWWENGKVWVKARGYKNWIKVTKVQSDSVYGKTRLGVLDENFQDVVILLEKVERIEREEKSPTLTLVGFSLGLSVVGLYFFLSSQPQFN